MSLRDKLIGSGGGTRPGAAMVFCVLFVVLAAVGLWFLPHPDPPPPSLTADQKAAAAAAKQAEVEAGTQQAKLVDDEDDRVVSKAFGRTPEREQAGPPTTVLPARGVPYDLAALISLGAAKRADGTTVDLVRSVLVAEGATLSLNAPGTTLRLASGPTGFTSIVGYRGTIVISGSADKAIKLTSWDTAADGPDKLVADGRSYVRAVEGSLKTSFAELSDLGFWSGRTGGLAITGSSNSPATGSITSTTVTGDHYGLFVADSTDVTVTDSTFTRNVFTGILLHRGSTKSVVEGTTASFNGTDGIAAEQGAQAVVLRKVTARENVRDGVRFDGQPLADEQGSAGNPLAGHSDFRIEGSSSISNGGDGVEAIDADGLVVVDNQITGHQNGIEIQGPSVVAQVSNNTVADAVAGGIWVRDGPTGIVIDGNQITGGGFGIQVRNAQADVRNNTTSAVTDHAVSLVGLVDGSSATGNTLGGAGRSALDVARVEPGAVVALSTNAEEGWDVQIPFPEYVVSLVNDHPLLPLWAFVLLVPIAAIVLRRRRAARRPYVETPGEHGEPAAVVGKETVLVRLLPASISGQFRLPQRRKPAASQPAASQPAASQPAASQARSPQPPVRQPAVRQPAVRQPAVRQPVASQPAARQPAARQPSAPQSRAAQQPTQRPLPPSRPAAVPPAAPTVARPFDAGPRPGSNPAPSNPAPSNPAPPKAAPAKPVPPSAPTVLTPIGASPVPPATGDPRPDGTGA